MTYTWLLLFTLSIPFNQGSLVVGWPFYNSKSFKPNGLASPFERKNRKIFSYLWALVRATNSAVSIAGPCSCQSPCWNPPPAGEDELAGTAPRAPTNNSGTLSHTLAMSRVPTDALAPPFAPAKLVAKYIDAELQRATKLALELFVEG